MCIVTTPLEAENRCLTSLLVPRCWAVTGCAPEVTGIGAVRASVAALDRASLSIDEIDLIELSEAVVAQVLAVLCGRKPH
jgi:acetyl-CoA C-acetyltransferase